MPRLVETEVAAAGKPDACQPPTAGVDGWIFQHIAKERPVRVGIAAIHDHMSAGDTTTRYVAMSSVPGEGLHRYDPA
jgi:hypothetical protein